MAQIMRAILLASAMATSIFGLRARSRSSHDPSRIDLAPIQFSRDIHCPAVHVYMHERGADDQQTPDVRLPGLGNRPKTLFATR